MKTKLILAFLILLPTRLTLTICPSNLLKIEVLAGMGSLMAYYASAIILYYCKQKKPTNMNDDDKKTWNIQYKKNYYHVRTLRNTCGIISVIAIMGIIPCAAIANQFSCNNDS